MAEWKGTYFNFKTLLYFEMKCICVCVCVFMYVCAQSLSYVWLMDCSPPGSSVGLPRQEYWNGVLFLSPGDLPNPGIKPTSLAPPAFAGRFLTTSATWEALVYAYVCTYRVIRPYLWYRGLTTSHHLIEGTWAPGEFGIHSGPVISPLQIPRDGYVQTHTSQLERVSRTR